MSFTQGLSGLNAASKDLDVIGNNVANANTVGFKGSQAQFGDVFAAALSGGGAAQIGIGVKLEAVAQQFTQGSITTTNNTLDMAINGPGFFQLKGPTGNIGYSRNGQFQLDKNGFIVSSAGHRLQGYPAGTAATSGTGTSDLLINPADMRAAASTTITVGLNLDSTSPAIPLPPAVGGIAFDPLNTSSFTNSTSTTAFDSEGNPQTVSMYFAKRAANSWDVYQTVTDPKNPTVPITYLSPSPPGGPAPGTWTPLTSLVFSSSGIITAGAIVTGPAFTALSTASQTLKFDFASATQFAGAFGVNNLVTDGFPTGSLSGFNTSPDGTIVGRYSNGQTQNLGTVALATFRNMNGLQPLGDNEWAVSGASGDALLGTPGTSGKGLLQTSSTEDSNVDLTAELVNMITAQRNYQANAQTIKTQDAVLQTLVNLR